MQCIYKYKYSILKAAHALSAFTVNKLKFLKNIAREIPTAAERYKFSELESDGKTFSNELLEQCKVHHVDGVKLENVMRVGDKDVIARQFVRALALNFD